jgi:hypothetical protein
MDNTTPTITTLTLPAAPTEDGYFTNDTSAFLFFASMLRGVVKRKEGGKFTGFYVKVYGEEFQLQTLDSLDKFLQDVTYNSQADVFRNDKQGVTIDFERD